MTHATGWEEAFDKAFKEGYQTKVILPKDEAEDIPDNFDQSRLSFDFGALVSYRDQKPRDSFQVREYDENWAVELDRYNPHYHPLMHAITDVREFFGEVLPSWIPVN